MIKIHNLATTPITEFKVSLTDYNTTKLSGNTFFVSNWMIEKLQQESEALLTELALSTNYKDGAPITNPIYYKRLSTTDQQKILDYFFKLLSNKAYQRIRDLHGFTIDFIFVNMNQTQNNPEYQIHSSKSYNENIKNAIYYLVNHFAKATNEEQVNSYTIQLGITNISSSANLGDIRRWNIDTMNALNSSGLPLIGERLNEAIRNKETILGLENIILINKLDDFQGKQGQKGDKGDQGGSLVPIGMMEQDPGTPDIFHLEPAKPINVGDVVAVESQNITELYRSNKAYPINAHIPAAEFLNQFYRVARVWNGRDGTNGSSVEVASNNKVGKTTKVVLMDKTGSHTLIINDGLDGHNGSDGSSVVVKSINKVGDTITIVITDKNGDHTITLKDGQNGSNNLRVFGSMTDFNQWKSTLQAGHAELVYVNNYGNINNNDRLVLYYNEASGPTETIIATNTQITDLTNNQNNAAFQRTFNSYSIFKNDELLNKEILNSGQKIGGTITFSSNTSYTLTFDHPIPNEIVDGTYIYICLKNTNNFPSVIAKLNDSNWSNNTYFGNFKITRTGIVFDNILQLTPKTTYTNIYTGTPFNLNNFISKIGDGFQVNSGVDASNKNYYQLVFKNPSTTDTKPITLTQTEGQEPTIHYGTITKNFSDWLNASGGGGTNLTPTQIANINYIPTIKNDITALDSRVGQLGSLPFTATNLVDAINQVNNKTSGAPAVPATPTKIGAYQINTNGGAANPVLFTAKLDASLPDATTWKPIMFNVFQKAFGSSFAWAADGVRTTLPTNGKVWFGNSGRLASLDDSTAIRINSYLLTTDNKLILYENPSNDNNYISIKNDSSWSSIVQSGSILSGDDFTLYVEYTPASSVDALTQHIARSDFRFANQEEKTQDLWKLQFDDIKTGGVETINLATGATTITHTFTTPIATAIPTGTFISIRIVNNASKLSAWVGAKIDDANWTSSPPIGEAKITHTTLSIQNIPTVIPRGDYTIENIGRQTDPTASMRARLDTQAQQIAADDAKITQLIADVNALKGGTVPGVITPPFIDIAGDFTDKDIINKKITATNFEPLHKYAIITTTDHKTFRMQLNKYITTSRSEVWVDNDNNTPDYSGTYIAWVDGINHQINTTHKWVVKQAGIEYLIYGIRIISEWDIQTLYNINLSGGLGNHTSSNVTCTRLISTLSAGAFNWNDVVLASFQYIFGNTFTFPDQDGTTHSLNQSPYIYIHKKWAPYDAANCFLVKSYQRNNEWIWFKENADGSGLEFDIKKDSTGSYTSDTIQSLSGTEYELIEMKALLR